MSRIPSITLTSSIQRASPVRKPNWCSKVTMLRAFRLPSLLTCMPLLFCLSCLGEGQPRWANDGPPGVGKQDSQKVLLLEAVKTGILSSLGMDREPGPIQKASDQGLTTMHQLYREKLRELRRNSSQSQRKSWRLPNSMTTVLLQATVEPVKVHEDQGVAPQSHQHIQWYRAVFLKNPNIRSDLTLARAELKISRQILVKLRPDQSKIRQEIQVNVSGMRPIKTIVQTHRDTLVQSNISSTQALTLDVGPGVEKWRRNNGSQPLFVEIGLAVAAIDEPEANPRVTLEIDLTRPKLARRRRQPRSVKEDDCNEQGWCCRKSVTVSFREIGWSDWVEAPTSYTMHYCDGTCPHNYKPASMHTQVKSRLHQITKGGTHRPCCVPATYEPMILMHYDSKGKLTLTSFNDLIVSKCNCA
ncbi:growth/differentiation factor 15 [Lampris incognitus]|uniref:growth/differentiation factor 15 n=1 Tax=Lampris incognitus TaxID=2546036 RepID=UPI0024B4AA80|nr:growth/differentiation factor 15 [Lampris incognitus]